jgi:hypothetical protein
MGAVWIRTRSELRASWRPWLALALTIGLAGGVALAAVAGARRTGTAYPRFVAWSRTADIETSELAAGVDPAQALSGIEHLPSVAGWSRVDVVAPGFVLPSGHLVTQPELFGVSDLRGTFLSTIDRPKVLGGRMYDPAAPDEAVIDFAAADRVGLHVGDVLGAVTGDPFAEHPATVPVRVVGIVAHPRVFPAFGANSTATVLLMSPAFASTHHVEPDLSLSSLELRLRGGPAGVPTFLTQARRAGLLGGDFPYVQSLRTAGVQRSTRIEADALWALACVILLAAGAVLGQALARQLAMSSTDFATLSAVGMSRRQLFGVGLLRAAVVGTVGAVAAVALAYALSPLTPIGLARVAEPTPGFAFDPLALLLGAVAVVVLTVALAALPAWRAARRDQARHDAATGAAAVAEVAAQRVPSPVAGVGVRMALEPGRGRTAVPVRSAILGAVLAIATFIAALTFWASLQHLVATPRLSGYTWDLFAVPPTDAKGTPIAADLPRIEATLRADADVAGWGRGGFAPLRVNGRTVLGMATNGGVSPVIVAGRAPVAGNEIALARAPMRASGLRIGDTVRVVITGQPSAPASGRPAARVIMRIVGEVVAPTSLGTESSAGQTAAISFAGVAQLMGQPLPKGFVDGMPYLIRFHDGVDTRGATDRLVAALPDGSYNVPSQHRDDITTLGRIGSAPLALALLLGAIALATLAQTLVTSVRARRRDLAILKTLGFSRRQVRGVVAWQATTLVAVALAVGVPTGIVAGHWIWRTFASGIAVVPSAILDPLWVLGAVVVTLLLANVIAAIPAGTAARTRPAVVLRSE